MAQVAPGRYQAEFEVGRSGSYQLMFSQTKEAQVLGRQTRGLAVGYPDELRLRPVNYGAFAFDRRRLGGPLSSPAPESVFDRPETTASRAVPLWPYLAGAAVLLFVVDVALRRIDLSLIFQSGGRISLSTRVT